MWVFSARYITGSYKNRNEFGEDEADPSSFMNLVTTMVSASIAAMALIGTSVMQASGGQSYFPDGASRGKRCFFISKMIFNYATIAFWLYVAVEINNDGKAIATTPLGCVDARLAPYGEGSCIFETVPQEDCGVAALELLPNSRWHSNVVWVSDGKKDKMVAEEGTWSNAYHGCSVRNDSVDGSFAPIWNLNEYGVGDNTTRMLCDPYADGLVDDSQEAGGRARVRRYLQAQDDAAHYLTPWNHERHPRHRRDQLQLVTNIAELVDRDCMADRCPAELQACMTDGGNIDHSNAAVRAGYERVFNGSCAHVDTMALMFNGDGDNDGTVKQRAKACATACATRKTGLYYANRLTDWDDHVAKGFILDEETGRCWCQMDDSATCARAVDSYSRYDLVGLECVDFVTDLIITNSSAFFELPFGSSSYNSAYGKHGGCTASAWNGRLESKTNFTKIKINLNTLQVDVEDSTFAEQIGSGGTSILQFASAESCHASHSKKGEFVVDLRGTPFAVQGEESCSCKASKSDSCACSHWEADGYNTAMSMTCTESNQVCRGQCGGSSGGCKVKGGLLQLKIVDQIMFDKSLQQHLAKSPSSLDPETAAFFELHECYSNRLPDSTSTGTTCSGTRFTSTLTTTTTTSATATTTTTLWYSAFQGKDKNPPKLSKSAIFVDDFEDVDAINRWIGANNASMPDSTVLVSNTDDCRGPGNSCLKFTSCGPGDVSDDSGRAISGSAFSKLEFSCSYETPCDVKFDYKGPVGQGFSTSDQETQYTFPVSSTGNLGQYVASDLNAMEWKRISYVIYERNIKQPFQIAKCVQLDVPLCWILP